MAEEKPLVSQINAAPEHREWLPIYEAAGHVFVNNPLGIGKTSYHCGGYWRCHKCGLGVCPICDSHETAPTCTRTKP